MFRECSLETHDTNPDIPEYALDTLHVVDEDAVKERGTTTGIKQLKSKGRMGSASTSGRPDDEPGSSKRNGIRFPRHAVKTLRDWVDAHSDNPYPTEEEKAELEKKTELRPSQIANWLANARRRRKVSDKARPKVCASPSLGPSTPAIDIPGIDAPKPWDELNPFERWRHSPPENEPASVFDIVDAMAHSKLVLSPFWRASIRMLTLVPSSYATRRRLNITFNTWAKAEAVQCRFWPFQQAGAFIHFSR